MSNYVVARSHSKPTSRKTLIELVTRPIQCRQTAINWLHSQREEGEKSKANKGKTYYLLTMEEM